MKLRRLQGVVDRVVNGIAAVVPLDMTREVYLDAATLAGAREGLEIDVLVSLPADPNGVGQVVGRRRERQAKPARMASFSGLVGQMEKVRARLRARLGELQADDDPDRCRQEEIDALGERIAWLERGLQLFRGSI